VNRYTLEPDVPADGAGYARTSTAFEFAFPWSHFRLVELLTWVEQSLRLLDRKATVEELSFDQEH